jgi:tau tubulin kinase
MLEKKEPEEWTVIDPTAVEKTTTIRLPSSRDVKVPPPMNEYPPHYPPFPEMGSLLGGRYFVLERLGQGTFCSIHKCIDLSYIPNCTMDRPCFVAAKVELSSFSNSGVLEGEAMVLRHLHESSPDGSFPIFCEYLRNVETLINPAELAGDQGFGPTQPVGALVPSSTSTAPSVSSVTISAIIMEYLPGEDMGRLRDRYLSSLRRQTLSYKSNSESVRSYSVGRDNMQKDFSKNETQPEPPQQQQPKNLFIKDNLATPIIDDLSVDGDEKSFGRFTDDASASTFLSGHQQSPSSRRININDAIYLCADVLLPLLKTMHEAGFIHRDVKPSNCVRVSTSSDNKRFVLVDFGLSKSFVVPVDSSLADPSRPWTKPWSGGGSLLPKSAVLRRERPNADFRGTSMYASLRVHQNKDYCRRDDLWSLWYVFCDFISGGLPWMVAAKHRDRETCRALKEEIHGNGNDRIGELLFGPEYHTRITASSSNSRSFTKGEIERLKLRLPNLNNKVRLLRMAFDHLCSLNFYDEPDYQLMESCLRSFGDHAEEEVDFEDVPTFVWDMPENSAMKNTSTNVLLENVAGLSLVDYCQAQPYWVDCSPELLRELKMAKAHYNSRNHTYYEDLSKSFSKVDVKTHLLADWLYATYDLIYSHWDVTKLEKWGNSWAASLGYRREKYIQYMERCIEYGQKFGNFRYRSLHPSKNYLEAGNGQQDEKQPLQKRRKSSTMKLLCELEYTLKKEQEKALAPPPKISFSAPFASD